MIILDEKQQLAEQDRARSGLVEWELPPPLRDGPEGEDDELPPPSYDTVTRDDALDYVPCDVDALGNVSTSDPGVNRNRESQSRSGMRGKTETPAQRGSCLPSSRNRPVGRRRIAYASGDRTQSMRRTQDGAGSAGDSAAAAGTVGVREVAGQRRSRSRSPTTWQKPMNLALTTTTRAQSWPFISSEGEFRGVAIDARSQ